MKVLLLLCAMVTSTLRAGELYIDTPAPFWFNGEVHGSYRYSGDDPGPRETIETQIMEHRHSVEKMSKSWESFAEAINNSESSSERGKLLLTFGSTLAADWIQRDDKKSAEALGNLAIARVILFSALMECANPIEIKFMRDPEKIMYAEDENKARAELRPKIIACFNVIKELYEDNGIKYDLSTTESYFNGTLPNLFTTNVFEPLTAAEIKQEKKRKIEQDKADQKFIDENNAQIRQQRGY